jgi:FdhD protein
MTTIDTRLSFRTITRLRDGTSTVLPDKVATEEPLEIRLGFMDALKGPVHRSISITMRTPGDDEALVAGFLFGESIIRQWQDIATIDLSTPNVARVELDPGVRFDPQRLERHFYTTSSCGVCGKASLESLSTAGFDALLQNAFRISAARLKQLPARLNEMQSLFNMTGGNHGVALFDAAGEISLVCEDVGRHNAMDKLIGHLLKDAALPLQEHGILVSGRASFELMQKALAAGCPMLAAIGAPSSLAVELAQEFNITLVGFLNERGMNLYHGAANVRNQ